MRRWQDQLQRVTPEEFEWLVKQYPLEYDLVQLEIHYGEVAHQMVRALAAAGFEKLWPLLAIPGIATRWESLLSWLEDTNAGGCALTVAAGFAEHLGRLTTYRALALTTAEFEAIQRQDSILPSGCLKTDTATLAGYVRREGIRKVLDMRMRNIADFPYDPSLSVHDYPETAVCVAEGYLSPPERRIYRLELDLPVIELIGWRMCDVNGLRDWFVHRGVGFDPTNPRTERFALFGIPFFSTRCKTIRVFDTYEEVADYLFPFAEEQGRLRRMSAAAGRV